MQGKVKWFDEKKGFGFICAQGVDHFAHFKQIISNDKFKVLKENDIVSFEQQPSSKGFVATQIKVLNPQK